MTSAQQEVYACMGVSPLLLIPDAVDSSRNVVVNVVEPGTLPSFPVDGDDRDHTNDLILNRDSSEEFDLEDEAMEDDRFSVDFEEDEDESSEALGFAFPIVKSLGVSSPAQEEKKEPIQETPKPVIADPPTTIAPAELEIEDSSRRRRRRSSALRSETDDTP